MLQKAFRFGLSGFCRALLLAAAGCGTAGITPVAKMPAAPGMPIAKTVVVHPVISLPPLLLHLPGIGGLRSLDLDMVAGLKQGGFNGKVEIYDWTEKDAGLAALISTRRNHEQAKIVAGKITDRFDKDPAAPIYLTGHSGGGGIAIWALEELPDRVKITTLILMSPALSPGYDLTKALRHVSGKAYVFSSMDDILVLSTGCRLFGTIDGVKTDAAGRVGFTQPAGADPSQYAKLIPMPWRTDWIALGDHGNHVGAMTHRFARLVLAPLILSGELPDTVLPTTGKSQIPDPPNAPAVAPAAPADK